MSPGQEIYQLKIRLLGISPMIWRRVLVPASATLRELHGILQVAMGWEGIHLFDIHAVQYGLAGPKLHICVNAELKFPRSAEVKFPTFSGAVISRFQ